MTGDNLIKHIIEKSEHMGIFKQEDVVVQDVRIVKYGNVVFHHHMEESRKTVFDYLKKINIKTIGRFGKWEYFWSDQSLLSGKINE